MNFERINRAVMALVATLRKTNRAGLHLISAKPACRFLLSTAPPHTRFPNRALAGRGVASLRNHIMTMPFTSLRGALHGAKQIGARQLALTFCVFFCVVGKPLANFVTIIDISVDNRGEHGRAIVTSFPPDPKVLFAGNFGKGGFFWNFAVEEPGWHLEDFEETGLFFGWPSVHKGKRYPGYWYAFWGDCFHYSYLGEFTEEQAEDSAVGHSYIPLATPTTPNPGGVLLGAEFWDERNERSKWGWAYVHTRLPETGSTLPLLAFALGIVLVAARRYPPPCRPLGIGPWKSPPWC